MPKGDRIYRIASSKEVFEEFLLSQSLNTQFFNKPFAELDVVQKSLLQYCNYFYNIIKNYSHTEEFQKVKDFYELISSRDKIKKLVQRIEQSQRKKKGG